MSQKLRYLKWSWTQWLKFPYPVGLHLQWVSNYMQNIKISSQGFFQRENAITMRLKGIRESSEYLTKPFNQPPLVSLIEKKISASRWNSESNPLPQVFHLYVYPISTCSFFIFLLVLLCASTIVKVTNIGTIKEVLLQRFIDLVVNVACPSRSGWARRDLGRVMVQDLAKVTSTLATCLWLASKIESAPAKKLTMGKAVQRDGCKKRAPSARPWRVYPETSPWWCVTVSTQLFLVPLLLSHFQSCPWLHPLSARHRSRWPDVWARSWRSHLGYSLQRMSNSGARQGRWLQPVGRGCVGLVPCWG